MLDKEDNNHKLLDFVPSTYNMTHHQCQERLRKLEFEAYEKVISVFRAQGPLLDEKRKLLHDIRRVLRIPLERHKAEIRKVNNNEEILSISEAISGSIFDEDWLVEGLRVSPILQRNIPLTSLTRIANIYKLDTDCSKKNHFKFDYESFITKDKLPREIIKLKVDATKRQPILEKIINNKNSSNLKNIKQDENATFTQETRKAEPSSLIIQNNNIENQENYNVQNNTLKIQPKVTSVVNGYNRAPVKMNNFNIVPKPNNPNPANIPIHRPKISISNSNPPTNIIKINSRIYPTNVHSQKVLIKQADPNSILYTPTTKVVSILPGNILAAKQIKIVGRSQNNQMTMHQNASTPMHHVKSALPQSIDPANLVTPTRLVHANESSLKSSQPLDENNKKPAEEYNVTFEEQTQVSTQVNNVSAVDQQVKEEDDGNNEHFPKDMAEKELDLIDEALMAAEKELCTNELKQEEEDVKANAIVEEPVVNDAIPKVKEEKGPEENIEFMEIEISKNHGGGYIQIPIPYNDCDLDAANDNDGDTSQVITYRYFRGDRQVDSQLTPMIPQFCGRFPTVTKSDYNNDPTQTNVQNQNNDQANHVPMMEETHSQVTSMVDNGIATESNVESQDNQTMSIIDMAASSLDLNQIYDQQPSSEFFLSDSEPDSKRRRCLAPLY